MERRLPPWLIKKVSMSGFLHETKSLLRNLELHTVCEEARCPNIGDCFSKPTATFLILGGLCTRNCSFCAVSKGTPLPLDLSEADRVALASKRLNLKHVIITSVTRDDLVDGGASLFALSIRKIRETLQSCTVEILTPDFKGDEDSLSKVIDAKPDIFNHNIETVERLYQYVRPQANYKRSLRLLDYIKKHGGSIITKSGLMVGLGETFNEVVSTMEDLRNVGCDVLTIGQYLQPTRESIQVTEYIEPGIFKKYSEIGNEMGFLKVYSAPFVRSSFNAEEVIGKDGRILQN